MADTPRSQEVLVPGSELLAIGGAGSCRLAPNLCGAGGEDSVYHAGYGSPKLLLMNEASPDVAQVLVAALGVSGGDPLQARVGAEPVEAQEKPLSKVAF